MFYYLGIDPSLRNTGICFRVGSNITFYEINTIGNVVESCLIIKKEFGTVAKTLKPLSTLVICIERQLQEGSFAALLFHVYQSLLEILYQEYSEHVLLVAPMPMQLKSYMKKFHNVDTSSKSKIVTSFYSQFIEINRKKQKLSSHKIEAYYLTLLGESVIYNNYKYTYRDKINVHPWKVLN